jgi:hypothetical protein
MKTPLKDYIFFKETEESEGSVFNCNYLSPSLGEPENGISTISLKLERIEFPLETFTVSSSLNIEQIDQVRDLHGLDMAETTKSVLKDEMEMGIEKKILEKIIESSEQNLDPLSKWDIFIKNLFGFGKKFSWKTPDDLVKRLVYQFNKMNGATRTPGRNFIIVNSIVASYLQDSPYFVYESLGGKIVNTHGLIYSVGHLSAGNIKVLVDPKFRFNKSEIYLGIRPDDSQCRIFAAESKKGEFLEKKTVNEAFLPELHIRLYKKFGISSVPSKLYSVLNIAEGGKSHNLFNHLIKIMKPFFKKLINPSFR